VWGVYVREAFRRRGVGERLVLACVDWARRRGLLVLKLSAVQGNGEAVRCYERCGFVAYGVEPAAVLWEGRLYDETLMALRL
jgi:GNAT superfamily N-acetyltransferase